MTLLLLLLLKTPPIPHLLLLGVPPFSASLRYITVAKAVIYYLLPLSIIGILYVLMARRLHLSAREMPGELAGPQRAQARARRHVARMVVTFVIGECRRICFCGSIN